MPDKNVLSAETKSKQRDDDMVSIIAHGIADAQGDAYAEYPTEFYGYAKAAVDTLRKQSAGISVGGVNVFGDPSDIKEVIEWQHSHATIDDVRTNLRHWREECGKISARKDILAHFASRLVEMWEFPGWEQGDDSAYEHEFIIRMQALAEEMHKGGYLK